MTDTATRTEKKLSVIPKGHWRNRWKLLPAKWHWADEGGAGDMVRIGPDEFLGEGKFPTSEIAEHRALMQIAASDDAKYWRYLGPVFFPDP